MFNINVFRFCISSSSLSLRYVGGGGDGSSFLAEGLATALALFDDLRKLRSPG